MTDAQHDRATAGWWFFAAARAPASLHLPLSNACPAAAGAINPDIKKDVEKVVDTVAVPTDLDGKPQVRCVALGGIRAS